jgi:Flp pilus assembly protein TadB
MSDQLAMAATVLTCAALIAPGHRVARARLIASTVAISRLRASVEPESSNGCVRPSGRAGASGNGWPGALPARAGSTLPIAVGAAVGLLVAVTVGGVTGVGAGAPAGLAAALMARRAMRSGRAASPAEPTLLAGAWDLLAASLRCGLPVASAVRAVAGQLPGAEGDVLRNVAELLVLGADPRAAWRPALALPSVAGLATAAIRTARSGAAMADAVDELAASLRASAVDRAEARAQRAGVLITGPLGLCFLPAFFCLGVVPVVIGLADQLLNRW